jgi:hypothetical protein
LPPQTGFPAPDAGQKKFNSRLVAPTSTLSIFPIWASVDIFLNFSMFGENRIRIPGLPKNFAALPDLYYLA